MMNWIRRLKNKIKRYLADPLKDPRCSECVHIDGPICPYPDYCESMKPTPTCYNCKFSYYGAGPEGCDLHASAYVHIGGYKVDWADFDGEFALRNFIKQWKE